MKQVIERLDEIRSELLSSIITIMENNGMDTVTFNENYRRAKIAWRDIKERLSENVVVRMMTVKSKLYFILERDDIHEEVKFDENDPELRDPYLLNTLRDNLIEVLLEKHTRVCFQCGKPMNEGYCIENGEEYFCSDTCLHQNYTPDEWDEMYDEDNGDSYWTEWEEDDLG